MVATSQHGKLSCCFFRASREPGTSQNGSALFNHCATKRSWSDNIFSPLFGHPFFSKRVDQPQLTRRDRVVTWLVTWSQGCWQLCSQVVCKPLENAVPSAESCLHIDIGLTRTWFPLKLYLPSLKRINLWGVPNWQALQPTNILACWSWHTDLFTDLLCIRMRQAAFAREWVAQGLRPECVAEAEESTRNPWPDVFFCQGGFEV